MSAHLRTPLLLTLLLAGCAKKDQESVPQDDTGYAGHETGTVDSQDSGDTGDSAETGDSGDTGDTGETGDTGDTNVDTNVDTETGHTGDTGETADTAPTREVASVALTPADQTVTAGTTYPLTATVTFTDGTSGTPPGVVWSSDDTAVATVDMTGAVTALAGGTTTLHGTFHGVDGSTTVTVTMATEALVTVINAIDGTPIEGATVEMEDGTSAVTDAAGLAVLPVSDADPHDFTAIVDDGYSAVSFLGSRSRVLIIPLTPKGLDPYGTVEGTMDFGSVTDAGWSQMVVGLVPRTFAQALATVSLESLFGENRTVTVLGTDAQVPSNLVIEGTEEAYTLDAPAGDVGVWGFAGPIDLADLSGATGGVGDVINLLLESLPDMAWGWLGGATVTSGGTTTIDLSPADAFSDTESLTAPGLPTGFGGDETWFLLLADECSEGWVVTGLGQGAGGSTIAKVPDGTSGCRGATSILATAEVGGLGSGGGTSTTTAVQDGRGTWTFDTPQAIPTVDAWDPGSRALDVTVDPSATFVRIRMTDDRQNVHDYYTSGTYSGTVPGDFSAFHRPRAEIEVWAVSATDATYEQHVTAGTVTVEQFDVTTAAKALWTP